MKVSGFTFLRNVQQLGYPFVASIRSILPIVDEFVVALGPSEDDTEALLRGIGDPKIRIIPTQWNERIRSEFPDAPLVAHPECTKAVRMLADELCSTEKMVDYCKRSPARQFIIATEAGMLHRLKKECPGKIFIPAPTDHCRCNECRNMKMNTLEKMYDCMANLSPQIELSDEIIRRARLPIERMLEISK